MKKVLLLAAIIMVTIYSCNSNHKTISDLEKQSLNTKIHIDTIFGKLKFGLTENDIYKLGFKKGNKYNFSIDVISSYDFMVTPSYYNDSLYRIEFRLMDATPGYDYDKILNVYNLKYGKPDTIYHDGDHYYSYWMNGNLEIITDNWATKSLNHIVIEYVNLSKDMFGKDIILDSDSGFDCWTKDYYNRVYLPNKKKKLNGI